MKCPLNSAPQHGLTPTGRSAREIFHAWREIGAWGGASRHYGCAAQVTSGVVVCRYKLRSEVVSEDVTSDFSVWVRWGDPPEAAPAAQHLSGMACPQGPSSSIDHSVCNKKVSK